MTTDHLASFLAKVLYQGGIKYGQNYFTCTKLQIVDTEKDEVKGTIKAKLANGTPVSVALEQAGPNTTEVRIRVGTFGDETASRALHQRIATRLGVAAR